MSVGRRCSKVPVMLKVLDTNILLLDAHNLINLGRDGSTVVIPATVIDEIDSKKSGHSEIAFQARQFARLLAKATTQDMTKSEAGYILTATLDGTDIMIVDPITYPSFQEHEPNIVRDRQIIYTASVLATKLEVTFISNDVMCRLRAQAEGLTVADLKVVDNVDIEFTKQVSVPNEIFTKLHNLSVLEADPDYDVVNYNYVFVDSDTAQTKLATVTNGFIQVLGKETEKELRKQDLNPINSGQLFMSKAIQDPSVDIVVTEALAGSGLQA